MRLIVGDLELNCPLVAMFGLGYYGKLELEKVREKVEKLRILRDVWSGG